MFAKVIHPSFYSTKQYWNLNGEKEESPLKTFKIKFDMYIKKQNFNEVIARWMKSDPDLWARLSKVEIKILHQRITKEYTFKKIAEEVDGTEELVHKLFLKVIEKIAKEVDHELAVELFILHKKIENPYRDSAFPNPSIYEIHLN